MRLDDYFDFVAEDDIRIKGHRLGIESVLYEHIHRAQTPEEVAARFPSLSLEQIYATILYYLHNRAQVERYIANWLEHGERMRAEQQRNPTPTMLKLRRARAEQEAADRQVAEARTS